MKPTQRIVFERCGLSKQDKLQKAVEAVEAFIKAGRKVPRLFGRELVEAIAVVDRERVKIWREET